MDRMTSAPHIGFGTWNRPDGTAYQCALDALEIGYRHLDCAEGYENEADVGRAISVSGLERNELWVTTKVAPESFGPGQVRPHVEASLEKLGVGPVDLLLLHYPSINDEYDIEDYMAQFAQVYDAGLTRNIGVSNFTIRYLDRAVELLGERRLLTNQVELHPFVANTPIVEHSRQMGIGLTAFSPLARGAVVTDPVLQAIAEECGATASQVGLAYLLAKGYWVIPSAGARERIQENFEAQNVELSKDQIAQIDALDRKMRLVDGSWCPKWDEY
ncbi:2,5-diketo-D-gluconate reductase B [Cognatiyoonia sediminum]|uniref:2,5-diketo-D-gluconate reductase B n=1 Tax=Cognatiyoonia sediminum TaxID=1508389 RepID=A0A1M5PR24_9RHOB|nr:aldo/keto reductase [Cognatiyoonia sediminum]SHH04181.1 2,5-diketo-D-gluconate reductase B [Cognatiyoonia sediminum]